MTFCSTSLYINALITYKISQISAIRAFESDLQPLKTTQHVHCVEVRSLSFTHDEVSKSLTSEIWPSLQLLLFWQKRGMYGVKVKAS